MNTKQTMNELVIDAIAELMTSKAIENRLSWRPQIVQTNLPKPSTAFVNTFAIFDQ